MAGPAEQAERYRQAARDARELAARTLAEAETEARHIIAQAQTEARRLADQAADADSDAGSWEDQVRLNAEITRTAAELEDRRGMLAMLGAEAAQLEQTARKDRAQLAELAGTRQDAEARLTAARTARDVAAIGTALTDLQAASMVKSDVSAELERVVTRLAVLQGDTGAIARAGQDFGRLALRLDELQRERDGLPPRQEVYAIALGLLPGLVNQMIVDNPEGLCATMLATAAASDSAADGPGSISAVAAVTELAEAARNTPAAVAATFLQVANALAAPVLLPGVLAQVEAAATDNPELYEEWRRVAFAKPPAAEPGPGPGGPGFGLLPDGGIRYIPAGA